MRAFSMLHAVKCQDAASYHAFSQRPTSSWCGLGSMFHAPLISWIAPARQKCIYPALMYAVMFYVILNKRKLHFPLAKNVMQYM